MIFDSTSAMIDGGLPAAVVGSLLHNRNHPSPCPAAPVPMVMNKRGEGRVRVRAVLSAEC